MIELKEMRVDTRPFTSNFKTINIYAIFKNKDSLDDDPLHGYWPGIYFPILRPCLRHVQTRNIHDLDLGGTVLFG